MGWVIRARNTREGVIAYMRSMYGITKYDKNGRAGEVTGVFKRMNMIKPPHASPEHPSHFAYDSELDDYPESEAAVEMLWKDTGGINESGEAWLSPRMQRNSAALVAAWENENSSKVNH